MIYLDHNATTPVDPDVFAAMAPYLSRAYGNPSSGYPLGRAARNAVETARSQVAGLLGCKPEEIVFTSGGTESNNTILKGVARTYRKRGKHILTTAIEHPAVTQPCLFLMEQGYDTTFVHVDCDCRINAADVQQAIRKETILISVMHANNETGVIQPIEEIGKTARREGILLHTDAAQSAGKIPVDVSKMHVDFASIAGHKLYAPKGVGAFYMREGIHIEPLMHGAGQESGRRAGTESVALAVALGTACDLAAKRLMEDVHRILLLRDRLYELLAAKIPELTINGDPESRLPNTLNVSFPHVDGARLLDAVPEIAASTGAACHDRSVTLSPVLAAMNVSKEIGRGAVRLTLGRENSTEEIDKAAEMIIAAYAQLRS